jgi:hypothetical protein
MTIIDGWTKQNAVNYCVDIVNSTLKSDNMMHNIENILTIYQRSFSRDDRERFYRSLWRNSVVIFVETSLEDEQIHEDRKTHIRRDLKKYNNANSAREFIDNANDIFNTIFGTELKANESIKYIQTELKKYFQEKYKMLLNEDITGPECLMTYVYSNIGKNGLVLPNTDDNIEQHKWILPDTILLGIVGEKIVGMNYNTTNTFKVSDTCCFCTTGIVTKAFAYQESIYGWKVYRACKDCEDFKKFCNYFLKISYVNNRHVVVHDLEIKENSRLDIENIIKTLKK